MSTCAFSFSLQSKLFLRSNPNECTHERSKSASMLIHESQRFRNKADGLYLTTPQCNWLYIISTAFFLSILKYKPSSEIYLGGQSKFWGEQLLTSLPSDYELVSLLKSFYFRMRLITAAEASLHSISYSLSAGCQ